MGLVEKAALLKSIAPPLDTLLANQLLDEFISLERRFIQRDWEPAELDGGQFSELLARILYHQDSGNVNPRKDFKECCEYIEDDKNKHNITPRHDAIHLVTIMKAVYKLRGQRGAVHISPNYAANQMDAKIMIEAVRWCMNDTLRIFWQGDRLLVAKAIREILQFDVPCVGVYEDVILVQRTDLSPSDEILVLLHFAGEEGFDRKQLGIHVKAAPPRITEALNDLASAKVRQVVKLPSGKFRLTDLGSKHIREHLADKLLLQ
jgi:hypothetical protein